MTKKTKFYCQNKIFKKDGKKFYGIREGNNNETPTIENIEKLSKQIRMEEKGFNEGSQWIKHTQEINENKQQQDWKETSKERLESALKYSHKWKSPGIDRISNFWIHALSKGHSKIASLLSDILEILKKPQDGYLKG